MTESHPCGDVITSSANPGIKLIRALQRRKSRQQERAFIVEGVRAVEDILTSGVAPRAIYLRDDFDPGLLPDVPCGMLCRRVSAHLFDGLTDVPHPQGILAIVPMLREEPLPDATSAPPPLVVIADGIRDPGNLGTLLRSAAGAGANHVVIGPESVDPYHPRAVRAAMGAHLRVPFSRQSWQQIGPVLNDYPVLAMADAEGDEDYDQIDWTGPSAIVIGGEAFGPTKSARGLATLNVRIPLACGVESLNAGVAGSLLLFEASRQRRAVNCLEKG